VPPRSALAIARAPAASRASTTGNAQSSGPASLSADEHTRSIAPEAGRRINRTVAGAPAADIARRTASIRGCGSAATSSARGGDRRRRTSACGGSLGTWLIARRRRFG